jgi:hypothetical protein
MSYIVIVDMDQPGIRKFVGLQADDEFSLAEFSHKEAKELKAKHSLGVFSWLLIGVREDNDIDELL